MIQTGEIPDGKTALGILFAAGFRAGLSRLTDAGSSRNPPAPTVSR